MDHYRENLGGTFHLDRDHASFAGSRGTVHFMRFVMARGAGVDLSSTEATDLSVMLKAARLAWTVSESELLTPAPSDRGSLMSVKGYRALVRPDTNEVMSVVTGAYRVADNALVADAAIALARRFDPSAQLVGAAGFGRTNEQTVCVVRVASTREKTLCLLAFNTHGGEGAIRFRVVEANPADGTVLEPDTSHATISIPHIGNVEKRLHDLIAYSPRHDLVADYLDATTPVWDRFHATVWNPLLADALVTHLWGKPRVRATVSPAGIHVEPNNDDLRLPIRYLTPKLADVRDAATAYKRLCAYLDNESEARERGDYTKDRDERLTLGAGAALKRGAWNWLVNNV